LSVVGVLYRDIGKAGCGFKAEEAEIAEKSRVLLLFLYSLLFSAISALEQR
jgi:hypothetical protein